jgi:hypothetical protein
MFHWSLRNLKDTVRNKKIISSCSFSTSLFPTSFILLLFLFLIHPSIPSSSISLQYLSVVDARFHRCSVCWRTIWFTQQDICKMGSGSSSSMHQRGDITIRTCSSNASTATRRMSAYLELEPKTNTVNLDYRLTQRISEMDELRNHEHFVCSDGLRLSCHNGITKHIKLWRTRED